MAQAKRKRKHRGTPAGTIERRGRTSKPPETASRAKAKRKQAAQPAARMTPQERRAARFENPPTWRGALNRAAFAAAILVVFIGLVQKNWVQAVIMGVFAMAIYIPMSYYTDLLLYRRFQRKKQGTGR